MHLGSLLAATGSYLDAHRRNGGRWLIRLDDLDLQRNVPGADRVILDTLARFGFRHDGAIERQSLRMAHYDAALSRLAGSGLLFRCHCSRREISAAGLLDEPRCVGGCRRQRLSAPADLHGVPAAAIRADLMALSRTRLRDRSGREIGFDPATHTDVVVLRRDGVVAYHLAVVVDDASQGVTDVVRGGDLLSATGWQLALQQALGLPTPQYLHLPLVTEPGGGKLAKSRRSLALDDTAAPGLLLRALALLGQSPPATLTAAGLDEIWSWALGHWDPDSASRHREVVA